MARKDLRHQAIPLPIPMMVISEVKKVCFGSLLKRAHEIDDFETRVA